jgi:glycine betaine/choline ABC-type transport system substrate-binding protein
MKMMSMRTRREPMTGPTARLRAVPAAVALMAVLAACGGAEDSATPAAPVAPAGPGSGVADGPTIVTRGQDFSEARTLAKVYALYLEGLGYPVEVLTAAGFRTEAIAALEAGQLGLIVDYIGGSLTALAPDAASSADADAIMEVIRPAYAQLGARVLQYAPAIDGDALIVRGDYDAVTISDLAGRGAVFGAAAQCFERPQCYLGLTDPSIYGITFGSTRTIEFGPLLGEALRPARSMRSSGTTPRRRSASRASGSSSMTAACSRRRTSHRSSPRCSSPPTGMRSSRDRRAQRAHHHRGPRRVERRDRPRVPGADRRRTRVAAGAGAAGLTWRTWRHSPRS